MFKYWDIERRRYPQYDHRAVLVIAGIAFPANSPCYAQGLKGAHMPKEIKGRLVYVNGDNDQERWKTFLDVQPRLIGMTFKQMDTALSGKEGHRVMTEVEYGLTEEPVKIGRDKTSWLHVRAFLKNGILWKYVVQAHFATRQCFKWFWFAAKRRCYFLASIWLAALCDGHYVVR